MKQFVGIERGPCCPQPDDGFPERHVSFLPTIPADKNKEKDYGQGQT
jgi:hypothetical protein